MGSYRDDFKHPFVTGFRYDLRHQGDSLSDEDYERIRKAVVEWGRMEGVPCDPVKTREGFAVAIHHALKDGDAFGLRLYLYLTAGIFRELEAEETRLTPRRK